MEEIKLCVVSSYLLPETAEIVLGIISRYVNRSAEVFLELYATVILHLDYVFSFGFLVT